MDTIEIICSSGSLTINRVTGEVVENNSEYTGLVEVLILRFDIEEWKKHYASELKDSIDILSIGFWYRSFTDGKATESYEPATEDWREITHKANTTRTEAYALAAVGPFQSYDEWEREIINEVIRTRECANSDAQGYVEANDFWMQQAWGLGLDAEQTVKHIERKATVN